LHTVRLGQAQTSARLMTELVDFLMYQSKKSPQTLHDRLAELMTLISRAVIEAGGEAAKVLDLSHRQAVALAEHQGVAEIRAWALNSLAELMTTIQPALVNKDLVQQAIEYIHENQRQPEMTLKDVASAVNLSPSHLAYLLKENLGVSYKKYLTSLRMGQAKKLLRTTDLTVAAIAQAVGYPNITNFYRLFQRETGTTPAEYRHSY
jgi:two-component system response regulator YesN